MLFQREFARFVDFSPHWIAHHPKEVLRATKHQRTAAGNLELGRNLARA
jgi:hypothetical protein